MLPSRFIAGFLTLSLAFGVVLGDFLHIQGRNDVQASDHLVAHADTVDVSDAIDTLSLESGGEDCDETSSQVTIVAPSGQRTCTTDAVAVTPTLTTKIVHEQTRRSLAFGGRDTPLFEYASLHAATVAMRI